MKIKLPIIYYKWLQGDNRITIDTPEWQEWLTQHQSFNYQDDRGSFTCRQRKDGSWIAQRTVHNKKRQLYIGSTLTFENLQHARQEIMMPDVIWYASRPRRKKATRSTELSTPNSVMVSVAVEELERIAAIAKAEGSDRTERMIRSLLAK